MNDKNATPLNANPVSESKIGKRILVIVDMQNDFVNGSLSNKATSAVVSKIINKLKEHYNEYDAIYMTRDIHFDNYLNTLEGKKLPILHCQKDGVGKNIVNELWDVVKELREKRRFVRVIDKHTFASKELIDYLSATCGINDEIEFCGVCTDICVVSNAICLRAELPNTVIKVDSNCCAGTSMNAHNAALKTMASCQIDIVGRPFINKHKNNKDTESEVE